MPPKRVVLRVHEQWLDDYLEITSDWLTSNGYENVTHSTRVGYIGGDRFHIIIDIEEDMVAKPADLSRIPLEIHRVFRGSDGRQMRSKHIDEKEQPNVYSAVRTFGQDFTWGC